MILKYYDIMAEIIDPKPFTARRTINKGTESTDEPMKESVWTGKEFRKHEIERLKLAGDLMIVSGKGTSKIRLSDMRKSKDPPKQYYISTNKGTGRKKIG